MENRICICRHYESNVLTEIKPINDADGDRLLDEGMCNLDFCIAHMGGPPFWLFLTLGILMVRLVMMEQ